MESTDYFLFSFGAQNKGWDYSRQKNKNEHERNELESGVSAKTVWLYEIPEVKTIKLN